MKLNISPLRKALTLSVLTIALAGSSVLTRANGSYPIGDPKGSASTAEVKYVGGAEGNRLFKVVYNNTDGSRFSLRVLDADGTQLYQGFFSDKKFNKTFKITNADNSGKLTFVIRNFQDNSTQSFEIDDNTRLVEDIEVKEVK
jgi:hypothetical protein